MAFLSKLNRVKKYDIEHKNDFHLTCIFKVVILSNNREAK